MLPVRCFTCNELIGHLWTSYMRMKQTNSTKHCLDEHGLHNMCCRRMLLSHVAVIDDIITYPNIDRTLDECKTSFSAFVRDKRTVACD